MNGEAYWFNYYGLAIMAVIMIPNIIYAVKHKKQVVVYDNKAAIFLSKSADMAVLPL